MQTLSYLQTGLHIATKPWRFIEQHPILLLAALLMLVGSGGTWVVMPLTGEFRLADLQPVALNREFKLVVLSLIALIFITTALRMPMLRLLVCYSLTVLLVGLALSLSMLDGERIQMYITESQSFRDIQHILALNAIPNAGRSVETALAFDAYHFTDRIEASLGILGWGAKLSILIAVSLSVFCLTSVKRKLIGVVLALIFALTTSFATGIGNIALAYLKVNQGVRAINSGEHATAMGLMHEAVMLDPVLAYSPGFTLLHSYLYFSTYGQASPLAKSYLLEQRFSAGRFDEVTSINSLTMSAEDLNTAEQGDNILPAMLTAHVRTEQRITMDAYNRMGLLNLWRKDWGLAENKFKSSMAINSDPVGQVALLRIYQQTRQFEACVGTADLLLQSTKNRSISADVWSSKGDCLSELGFPARARYAYEQSIALDSDKNYRAVKGLSGT